MYLWAPPLESVRDLRSSIWESMALNDVAGAKAAATALLFEAQKLIRTLESFDEPVS